MLYPKVYRYSILCLQYVYSSAPLALNSIGSNFCHTEFSMLLVGIGMDSCVIPLRFPQLSLVQTTDFFYPLVDDPYIQVNVLKSSMDLTQNYNW